MIKSKFLTSVVFLTTFFPVIFLSLFSKNVVAQNRIEPPNRKYLFEEDDPQKKKLLKKKIKKTNKRDAPVRNDLDFKAPKVDFVKEKNLIKGEGGVLISQSGVQVQAQKGQVDLNSKIGKLDGDVLISTPDANIGSSSSEFNFELETGQFKNAEIELDQDGYAVSSTNAQKFSENGYQLEEAEFSTCHCPDKYQPWSIKAGSSDITKESYAHCFSNWLQFQGLPFFYTPYIAFPVKQERQSGLLVPDYGYSSKDGFQYKQPIFVVLDESTDMTVSPFIETQSRAGSVFDFRKAFSKDNNLSARLLYSNESQRGEGLRGTNVSDIFDKDIDVNRLAGFYSQVWRSDAEAAVPLSLVSDIHLISDYLIPREINDDDIALYSSRYLTSVMLLSTEVTDNISAELSGEYTQLIEKDGDYQFQRLPELNLSGNQSFRPFGVNPYGLKLVARGGASVTEFQRDKGYDGTRADLFPTLAVPFHFQNYVNNTLSFGVRQTHYDQDDVDIPGSESKIADTSDRRLFYFGYGASSAVERIFELDRDSWLTYLTSLGSENQDYKLRRIKHTVEPFVRYTYIPGTSQGIDRAEAEGDNPFYDAEDRVPHKSAVLYGFTTGLTGRFLPTSATSNQMLELTPKYEDLPGVGAIGAISDIGSSADTLGVGSGVKRVGEIRDLVNLTVKQAYDYVEDHNHELNRPQKPFSDVSGELSFFPTKSFAMAYSQDLDAEKADFSAWSVKTQFKDDRGDAVRALYDYHENSTDQLVGNLELALNEQLKVGYFTRFDDRESEFIENRVALRLISSCKCWFVDLGYSERIDVDKEQVFLRFTLAGLGDVKQDFGLSHANKGTN